jgi:hypothetical protein
LHHFERGASRAVDAQLLDPAGAELPELAVEDEGDHSATELRTSPGEWP